MDKYIEVINEIEKFAEIIKTPRYRMFRHSLLEFLKAFCYIKNVKNVNNVYMDCLFPKKENKESKTDWLAERNIRMHTARLSAIIDELEDYYHYEEAI